MGVALIGETLVDCYLDGRAVPGGAPFNVARWLAAFGVATLFISRIGQGDAAAGLLQNEWRRFHLPGAGLQVDPTLPSGVVRVHPATSRCGEHRFEIEGPSAWDAIDAAAAVPLLQAAAPSWLCFGTLAMRQPVSKAAVRQLCDATAATRLCDLNLRDAVAPDALQGLAEAALQLADWVKLNDGELQRVLQWFVTDGADPPASGSPAHGAALAALCRRFDLQRLVVTEGERGWFSCNVQGAVDHRGVAASGAAPFQDSVGAGDAFVAVLLATLLQGRGLAQALRAAARLGAAACSWRGALPHDLAVIADWRERLDLNATLLPAVRT